jgi:hypothetical protein
MLYQRQESLKLKLPKAVGIVGVGGVGSWLALYLALAGVEQIWMWDHDEVSIHNLNRLPLTPDSIGKNKAEALAEELVRFRPDLLPVAIAAKFTPDVDMAHVTPLDYIIAGTDTLASRNMVAEWAKKNNVRYMEIAAEGEIGTVTAAPAEWATEEEANPGYASVPVWVGPCVMSAAVASSYILHGSAPTHVFRMGWNITTHEVDTLKIKE